MKHATYYQKNRYLLFTIYNWKLISTSLPVDGTPNAGAGTYFIFETFGNIQRKFWNFQVTHEVSQVTVFSKMINCVNPVNSSGSSRPKRKLFVEFTTCDAILTSISLLIYVADIISG